MGNSDVYATLKSKLENLPENIVVMASQTQLDSRKEKVGNLISLLTSLSYYNLLTCILNWNIMVLFQSHPGGFLFTKFGGNQTALLDLAFPV